METLETIRKRISNVYQRLSVKPEIIKMNEKWLEEQLENEMMTEDRKILGVNTFAGIPIETVPADSYIKTFEFGFKKGTYGGFY